MTTIPNTMSKNPEAIRNRTALNGGTAPRSLWVLNSWMTRADDDREDTYCPSYPEIYETRELALQGFRDEMHCDLAEWEPEDRDSVDVEALVRILDETGMVDATVSIDGMITELSELPVWSGARNLG